MSKSNGTSYLKTLTAMSSDGDVQEFREMIANKVVESISYVQDAGNLIIYFTDSTALLVEVDTDNTALLVEVDYTKKMILVKL